MLRSVALTIVNGTMLRAGHPLEVMWGIICRVTVLVMDDRVTVLLALRVGALIPLPVSPFAHVTFSRTTHTERIHDV